MMFPARFGQSTDDGVICRLCPHLCHLRDGQTGRCHVRHNQNGQLVTSAYGRPVLTLVEPIEKKYLFHAFAGTTTLSLATAGCNLGCKYCINWRVSQTGTDSTAPVVTPDAIIQQAKAANATVIAFTYTEPTIFIEYAVDVAQAAHDAGLKVVAKSNGFIEADAFRFLRPHLDAISIDLKGWRNRAHAVTVGGEVDAVLRTLKLARELDLWTEVVTLIVPSVNDDRATLDAMAAFIAGALGVDTPWHLLRFYPNYHMQNTPVTSQTQMSAAVDAARAAGLQHVYNKELARGEMLHTDCHMCGTRLIERRGYHVQHNHLMNGRCPTCHTPLAGVGLSHIKESTAHE